MSGVTFDDLSAQSGVKRRRPGEDDDDQLPPRGNLLQLTAAELGMDGGERRSKRQAEGAARKKRRNEEAEEGDDEEAEDDERKGHRENKDEYELKKYRYTTAHDVAGLNADEMEDYYSSCDENSEDEELFALMEVKEAKRKEKHLRRYAYLDSQVQSMMTSSSSSKKEEEEDDAEDGYSVLPKKKKSVVLAATHQDDSDSDDEKTRRRRPRRNVPQEDEAHHNEFNCFACMWGNRDVNSVKGDMIAQMLELAEHSLGREGLGFGVVARCVHLYFKHKIFFPMRKEGKKVPMWRTRSIYGHFLTSKEPRLVLYQAIRKAKIMEYAMYRMIFKRHKESTDDEPVFRFDPVAHRAYMQTQARILELYKVGNKVKQMMYYHEQKQHDGARMGAIIDVGKFKSHK